MRSDVAIEGMTCAGCAAKIERDLTRLDGVESARVNFANGRATVQHADRVDDAVLRSAIEALGYTAPRLADAHAARRRQADLGRRATIAAVLGLPVVLVSMVPALRFDGWEWLAGVLATPVIFWAGGDFHRTAAAQPPPSHHHHGHARVDGHRRRLGVVDRRPRPRSRRPRLLRDRGRDRRADPAREVAGGPGHPTLRRRHPGPRRPGSAHRTARGRSRDPRGRPPRGRPLPRPARRPHRHRRRGGRRTDRARRLHGHRRAGSGRGRPGRRRAGCDREHPRVVAGGSDARRGRHGPGADHPPRRRGPGRPGTGAAPGRSCRRRVRARSHRDRRRHGGGLVGIRRHRRGSVHGPVSRY